MKRILGTLYCAALIAGFGSPVPAAPMTTIGMITDNCDSASRAKIIAAQRVRMTDHDVALACVRDGGEFVFVVRGNLYQIANQSQADLGHAAGSWVSLTGDFNATTITVSRLTILAVYYTGDGTLGGGGDSVCQEYYGPDATDITSEDPREGGTICAVPPTRSRNLRANARPR